MRSDPTWSSSGCVKSSIASLFTMDATYACKPYTAKHSCHENRCGDGSRHKPCLFRSAETRLRDSCYSNLDEPLTHKRLRFGDIVLFAKLGKDLTATKDDSIGAKTEAHIFGNSSTSGRWTAYLEELLNHAQLRTDDPHLWVAEENAKAQHSAANKSEPHADESKACESKAHWPVLKPRAGSIRAYPVIRLEQSHCGQSSACLRHHLGY